MSTHGTLLPYGRSSIWEYLSSALDQKKKKGGGVTVELIFTLAPPTNQGENTPDTNQSCDHENFGIVDEPRAS